MIKLFPNPLNIYSVEGAYIGKKTLGEAEVGLLPP
jgi:hypothetical protein